MPYTYIVECADGTYYTGWTTDLGKRLRAHNEGKGARYTRGRGPVRLVYSEFHNDRRQAQSREAIIKHFSREEKERLIGAELNL